MMKTRFATVAAGMGLTGLVLILAACEGGHTAVIEPENEQHAPAREDAHAGEDGAAGHEEGVVRLDEHQLASIDIEVVEVRRGSVAQTIKMPGEISWNADRVVHVTARVPGVVLEVFKTLGDRVTAGERLTTLDSPEIGQARIDYLKSISQFDVARAELARLEEIARNTRQLMDILVQQPPPDEALKKSEGLRVGDFKTKLLGAYTRLHVARRTWDREQGLYTKQISSEEDYLEAMGSYETARSDYQSLGEAIGYELELEVFRKRSESKVARTQMLMTERTLHVLGLTNDETHDLKEHAEEIDEEISRVGLRASIDGLIVERHLSVGERVDSETPLFKMTDTEYVWFMGRAHERDLSRLKPGLKALVELDAYPGEPFEGVVDYLGGELDRESRTLAARVVLPNPEGRLRSGLFGQVTVFTEGNGEGLLVPVGALRRTAEGHIVFKVREPGVFKVTPVQVLEQNDSLAQVSGDLSPGDRLASGDTLILKAEAEREALGGGHGH